ncbi:class I SAM-dependent methyltransferase [Zavarzinia sp. CC-PAN008]|uniref:class I SAM-dependent methyltransferase n=1 Tax=Zavarzinia sp. CC-PAN008 TaxID=3243332 RepID=UPI003F74749F
MTAAGDQSSFHYSGGELALFEGAVNWKSYWAAQVRPFIRGRVADIGAGLGSNVRYLAGPGTQWTCVEPDPALAAEIARRLDGRGVTVLQGTLASLPAEARFDTILYVDVLEHIADDRAEVAAAAARLAPGGHLVVVAPAHQWLFSPMDEAVGHFRRYTLPALRALTPPGLAVVRARYLDSVGIMASAANRFVLRKEAASGGQMQVWDRLMVPASRLLDPLTAFRLGKTAVLVWRKDGAP